MNITFVLPGYPWKPVGGYRVVYEYANHLVARGHDVVVVHARELPNWKPAGSRFYGWLRGKAAKTRNTFLKPSVSWQPVDARVKMLFVPSPLPRYIPDGDAVFATFWPLAELAAEYPEAKGKKFHLVMDFYPYLGTKAELEKAWRFPCRKIAISSWLRDMVLKSGIEHDDVSAIPIGIDGNRFLMNKPAENRKDVIAMMVHPAAYKASQDGIEALRRVKEKSGHVQFTCFGTFPRKKILPAWIDYMENASEKELVGIYSEAKIFISSSLMEGFALPPAEAMACGCAVAATDSGGIREFAEHEKTALLSPPGNPDALAENILRLLEDDALRLKLAKEGHERISGFTWDRSTDMLEQFLKHHVKT